MRLLFMDDCYTIFKRLMSNFTENLLHNLITSVKTSEDTTALYERANSIFEEVSMQLAQ